MFNQTQSFPLLLTLMVKIRGWEDEESWVGSKFAACMWIFSKEALTGGQILHPVQEEYLRKRIMSTNWVCAGAFVDNGWVSSRKIFQQEEETLSMAMDFRIDVLGVVQWSLLLFSAPTDLNRILGTELKIKKVPRSRQWLYHGRYCETIWRETHTEVVYVNLGGQSPTTHTKRERGINKEMKGWRVKEKHTRSSSSDGDDDEEQPRDHAPSCSPDRRRKKSSVKKTTAV